MYLIRFYILARPCDPAGHPIPPNQLPLPLPDDIDWSPFPDRPSFEYAQLIYEETQLAEDKVNSLLRLTTAKHIVDGRQHARISVHLQGQRRNP